MGRMFAMIFVIAFFASATCVPSGAGENEVNILEYFDEQYVTRVYVSDIVNSTDNEEVEIAFLKELLENAFLDRVSQDFEIARTRESADVALDMKITEYLWTDEDPVDNLLGIGGVVMDAAKQENYARMIAKFTLTDIKTGDVVWEDTLKATITDEEMSEGDSYEMIYDRIVKVFTMNLFSRHKARER